MFYTYFSLEIEKIYMYNVMVLLAEYYLTYWIHFAGFNIKI